MHRFIRTPTRPLAAALATTLASVLSVPCQAQTSVQAAPVPIDALAPSLTKLTVQSSALSAQSCALVLRLSTLTQPRSEEPFTAVLSVRSPCGLTQVLSPQLRIDAGINEFTAFADRSTSDRELNQEHFFFDDIVLPAGAHEMSVQLDSGTATSTTTVVEGSDPTLELLGYFAPVDDNPLEPLAPPTSGSEFGAYINRDPRGVDLVSAWYTDEQATYELDVEVDWDKSELTEHGLAIRFWLPLEAQAGPGHLQFDIDGAYTDWYPFTIGDFRAGRADGSTALALNESSRARFAAVPPLKPKSGTDSANASVRMAGIETLLNNKTLLQLDDNSSTPANPKVWDPNQSPYTSYYSVEKDGWAANYKPFSGLLELDECVNREIRKIAIILQLDDKHVKPKNLNQGGARHTGKAVDAFNEKRKRTVALFKKHGFHEIHIVTPPPLVGDVPKYREKYKSQYKDFQGRKGVNLLSYYLLLSNIAEEIRYNGEEACTEVVITTLSHGNVKHIDGVATNEKRAGHFLTFRHVVGRQKVALDQIATRTLAKDSVNEFVAMGNNETPITFLINACQSGAALGPTEKAIKELASNPPVLLMATSAGSQPTRSIPRGRNGVFKAPVIESLFNLKGGLSDPDIQDRVAITVKEQVSKMKTILPGGGQLSCRQTPQFEFVKRRAG